MKRLLLSIIIISFLISPSLAVDFPTSRFTENGVTIYARATADTPWNSPFTESVTLSLSVEPNDPDTISVNVTDVLLTLHSRNPTGPGFSLIDAKTRTFTTPLSGSKYINYTGDFTLSSSMTGERCYFGVTVQGVYSNTTIQREFLIASNESFIGPFLILASLATPQVYVGLLIGIFASAVIIMGIVVVKRNRSLSKRRRLLTD